MADLFMTAVNLSVNSIFLIGMVALFRGIFKRVPKKLICFAWGVVAIRMVCPFPSIDILDGFPFQMAAEKTEYDEAKEAAEWGESASMSADDFQTADYMTNRGQGHIAEQYYSKEPDSSFAGAEVMDSRVPMAWAAVMLMLSAMHLFMHIKLERIVSKSVPIRCIYDSFAVNYDKVYVSDDINTPFVIGIIRPRIYVPSFLDEETCCFAIIHEECHIKRHDNLWKLLGLAVLTMHWFNPFAWAAYKMFSNDIEMACDESATYGRTKDDKKKYALSLLKCSCRQNDPAAAFTAFGTASPQKRIIRLTENIKMNSFSVAATLALCVIISACSAYDPVWAGKGSEPGNSAKADIHITASGELAYLLDGKLVIDESLCSEYRKTENITNKNILTIADDEIFITVIDKDGHIHSTCPYDYESLAETGSGLMSNIAEGGGNLGTGGPDAEILKELSDAFNVAWFTGSFSYDGYSYADNEGRVFHNGKCVYSGNAKVVKIAGRLEENGAPYQLMEDGTLNAEFLNHSGIFVLMHNNAEDWTDIKDISGTATIAALTWDGRIKCEDIGLQEKAADWREITDFSYKYGNLVCADKGGRVYFASENPDLNVSAIQDALADWHDVIAVDCNNAYIVGLTRNGVRILRLETHCMH